MFLDVGEGNCIVLRCGNETVIVDAGSGKSPGFDQQRFILPKIISLAHGTVLKAIFVTHPHDDHCNLIMNLIKEVCKDNAPPQIFLGGSKMQWESCKILSSMREENIPDINIQFITDCNSIDNNKIPSFLHKTKFTFILPKNYICTPDPNQCSFFLKVNHGDNP